jgi:fused signal recognition particle receptor
LAATPITGIVLTKMDGSAKGGAILAVERELKVPIKLIGIGEGLADLRPFDPEAFVAGLF